MVALGSNPLYPFLRRGAYRDLQFAQDTSISGRFAQQRKFRMLAQAVAFKGVTKSKLRRLLAREKSFNCTDVAIGDSVLLYKAVNRRSEPQWRGQAKILDYDKAGATVKIQSRTF